MHHPCYVLNLNDNIVAYCTVKYNNKYQANIGLVGVDSTYKNKGFGQMIICLVSNILFEEGYKDLFVVTQARNYNALKLYQKTSF